jgi:hypothetical protein
LQGNTPLAAPAAGQSIVNAFITISRLEMWFWLFVARGMREYNALTLAPPVLSVGFLMQGQILQQIN